jgi:hypothetical protein
LKRAFWIAGLSITLIMFGAFAIMCVIALVVRNHLSLNAWIMLVVSGYSSWFIFRCLRSAIRHGDPTTDLQAAGSEPASFYDYVDEDHKSR